MERSEYHFAFSHSSLKGKERFKNILGDKNLTQMVRQVTNVLVELRGPRPFYRIAKYCQKLKAYSNIFKLFILRFLPLAVQLFELEVKHIKRYEITKKIIDA